MVGLATLARNDGVLLGAARDRLPMDRCGPGARRAAECRRSHGVRLACFGLFLVVHGALVLRQLAVFGSLSPSVDLGPNPVHRELRPDEQRHHRHLAGGLPGPGDQAAADTESSGSSRRSRSFVIACSILLVPFVLVAVGAPAIDRFRAVLSLRRPALRRLGTDLRGPRAVRDVPPLGEALIRTRTRRLEGVVIVATWAARHRRGWQEDRAAAGS